MAAISQVIPNLLGGVSQQSDPIKLPGQVKEAENVLLDPTFGCKKRPPTKFIKQLATDIPADANWFPIFRDNNERYVVAIYKNSSNQTTIRVWEADTGTERTVTLAADASGYLEATTPSSIKTLTIADYTFLCNSEKIVTMAENTPGEGIKEALVVINQVAYNTSYSIDFLKDGQSTTQEKIWKATKLTVSPGSRTDTANGNCSDAAIQTFTEDGDNGQLGLGFTLNTSCNPTLQTDDIPGQVYPTGVVDATKSSSGSPHTWGGVSYGLQAWMTSKVGSSDNYAVNSYVYSSFTDTTNAGNITVKVECRISEASSTPGHNRYNFVNATITNYTTSGSQNWATGTYASEVITLSSNLAKYPGGTIYPSGSTVGVRVSVSSVQTSQSTPEYSYHSEYSTRATLNNGGQNWRIGDTVSVTMADVDYTITVAAEEFTYNYATENQVSYTTPADTAAGTLDVGTIVSDLTTSINALSNYTATPIGNVIHILRTDARDFNIQTRGGTTNNALYGIKGSVNDVSLLPTQCINGVILQVRNTAESDADDYYVKFTPATGDIPGQGSWEETVKPNILTDINPSTMPYSLIREADGTFTVRPFSSTYSDTLFWAGRGVGDEKTNPEPSFIGKSITDMFFYMNRFGVLSGDAVILSQPGDYFNFFVGSAIAVSDADPVDMTTSSTKPANLSAAVGTPKGLLLFAQNNQFLLSTEDTAFGPATAKMTELASYSYNSNISPLETGVSILFHTEAHTFSKVYEMAVDSVENRPIVAENTSIVPEYIPPGLTWSCSSPNNSFSAWGNNSDTIWTFKFHNKGNERSMAGWSKWVMPSPVVLLDFYHDTGYMVQNNDGSHILTKLEMLDDPNTSPINAFGQTFTPRVDNYLLKSEVTVVENPADADTKIIRLPTGFYVVDSVITGIITTGGTATLFTRPDVLSDATGYYVIVRDAIADADFVIGLEYSMLIALPTFLVREDNKADKRNIPMVENAYINIFHSGRYNVKIERKGYIDRNIDLVVTDADLYTSDAAALDEVATKAIPIYCRGDFSKLTITASDPLPTAITSYSWEGHYSNRGISILR